MVISSAINLMIFLIYEKNVFYTYFSTPNGVILCRLKYYFVPRVKSSFNNNLHYERKEEKKCCERGEEAMKENWLECCHRNHSCCSVFNFFLPFPVAPLFTHFLLSIYATCKMQSMENYCFKYFPIHWRSYITTTVINEKFQLSRVSEWRYWKKRRRKSITDWQTSLYVE